MSNSGDMKPDPAIKPGGEYWEQAGELGYARAMYRNAEVGEYLRRRLWNTAIEVSKELAVQEGSHVLDLGCGDGDFANLALAQHFAKVDGLDVSQAGIRRARANVPREGVQFDLCDITRADFSKFPRYDAVFLMGILHHVKAAVPVIVHGLCAVTDKVVVLEPNGNHPLRKLMELSPKYRAAGEDSFRARQLERIFAEAGFARAVWRRLNLMPNFTPRFAFKLLLPLEPIVESTPVLRTLCTVNAWGFVAENPVAHR